MEDKYHINVKTDALLLVDVQRDFCPGGALPVLEGDEVIPVLNKFLSIDGLLKIATRDWHPPSHCSFKAQGGQWPPHCVQNTPGAELHPDLKREAIDKVISKGTDPDRDAYSGFEVPELSEALREHKIRRLWIGGLATEYCVRATALDARNAGYEVFVIADAVRGIDVEPGDCEKAKQEMAEAGIEFVQSADILKDT